MTAQANNGLKKSWILNREQPLKKKGVGHGIHQSDIICSIYGWIKEASQTLEYGKNYEGYWNGELFIKQVRHKHQCNHNNLMDLKQLKEKIIPAFEKFHGPDYQALFLIDNSQGHSAYAEDALVVSQMNFNPSGKQAKMRDGWFDKDGH